MSMAICSLGAVGWSPYNIGRRQYLMVLIITSCPSHMRVSKTTLRATRLRILCFRAFLIYNFSLEVPGLSLALFCFSSPCFAGYFMEKNKKFRLNTPKLV